MSPRLPASLQQGLTGIIRRTPSGAVVQLVSFILHELTMFLELIKGRSCA